MPKVNNLQLLAKLANIARLEGAPLDEVLAQLEIDFAEYVAAIKPLVTLEPEDVIAQLQTRFPDIALALNNPLAERVVRKIQDYLIRKGSTL